MGRREPVMMGVAIGLLLRVPLALLQAVEGRQLGGEALRAEPMRLALSLGLYLATLSWFTGWMTRAAREAAWVCWTIRIGVAAIIFEQAWITLQAARGLQSHCN